jgi:hypothetical protein
MQIQIRDLLCVGTRFQSKKTQTKEEHAKVKLKISDDCFEFDLDRLSPVKVDWKTTAVELIV